MVGNKRKSQEKDPLPIKMPIKKSITAAVQSTPSPPLPAPTQQIQPAPVVVSPNDVEKSLSIEKDQTEIVSRSGRKIKPKKWDNLF